MLRPLFLAATATGLVAALTLACTDWSDPSADAPETLATATASSSPRLTVQHSGTTNRLQAISPVNANVVWASGVGGSYAVTTNGGRTWRAGVVPGAEALQFRDVQAVSATEAYLLAAGVGTDSRVYKTKDAGHTWKLQFKNRDPNGFYDCFAFWTPNRGITMADAVNGRFPVIRTTDGSHWTNISSHLPAAQAGEAAFAASGTCVATQGTNRAWIGTGGAAKARIIRTADGGDTWKAYQVPIIQGTPSSGVITVAFRDASHGILAGGELAEPTKFSDNVAVSGDGGRTWQLARRTPFPGAAYGLSYVGGTRANNVVITGPGGAAWSRTEGQSWHLLPGVKDYWAVAFAGPNAGWLVGTEGRILKVEF
jgi:photosystem II stability/assembly factor-like uncharacterized protein